MAANIAGIVINFNHGEAEPNKFGRFLRRAARNVKRLTVKACATVKNAAVKTAFAYGDATETVFNAIFGSKTWMQQHPDAFTLRFMAVGMAPVIVTLGLAMHSLQQDVQNNDAIIAEWDRYHAAQQAEIERHAAVLDTVHAAHFAGSEADRAIYEAKLSMEHAEAAYSTGQQNSFQIIADAVKDRLIADAMQHNAKIAQRQLEYLLTHDETKEQAIERRIIAEIAAESIRSMRDNPHPDHLLTIHTDSTTNFQAETTLENLENMATTPLPINATASSQPASVPLSAQICRIISLSDDQCTQNPGLKASLYR